MRIALACSVVTHCASFRISHECSVSYCRLHIKLGFWWLLPPEMTSEYRTYGHMIHACIHWIIWGKYGASWTTKAISLHNAGSNPRYWPCVYFALFRTGSARRTPGDLRGAGGRPAGVPITFLRCAVFNMRAHSTPSRLAHSVCLGFLI